MIEETIVKPKILGYKIKSTERDELLHEMADYLSSLGYVKSSYGNSVIERENKYPTGIDTDPIPVAIPHSEREEVLKTAILGRQQRKEYLFRKLKETERGSNQKLFLCLRLIRIRGSWK